MSRSAIRLAFSCDTNENKQERIREKRSQVGCGGGGFGRLHWILVGDADRKLQRIPQNWGTGGEFGNDLQ